MFWISIIYLKCLFFRLAYLCFKYYTWAYGLVVSCWLKRNKAIPLWLAKILVLNHRKPIFFHSSHHDGDMLQWMLFTMSCDKFNFNLYWMRTPQRSCYCMTRRLKITWIWWEDGGNAIYSSLLLCSFSGYWVYYRRRAVMGLLEWASCSRMV